MQALSSKKAKTMTNQERESLEEFIKQLIDDRLITEPEENKFFSKIKAWLLEQGTQRGIIRVLSAFLILKFDLDAELAVSVVAGTMALTGLHDAVTKD
jgi:hypothetical protein